MPEPGIDSRRARLHFERAARSYLKAARLEAEIGGRMLERLDYVRLAPRRVLDAGSGPPQRLVGGRYPRADVIALDFSLGMLRAGSSWRDFFRRRISICADFARMPLAAGSIDLAWSNMALHWAADPLAVLHEFHRVLATGGLLMFSTLGPDTLIELRAAAGEARVHAFADMHDLGDMLVAAGFAAPVMDMERLTLLYENADALFADLRATGQTGAQRDMQARGLSGRRFLSELRRKLDAGKRDGKLPVSFEVVYGHAWKAAARKTADGSSIVQFERSRQMAP
ncbi:MAG: methyltransferase domain-containing protein [Burkholderiales bacterium]